MSMSEIPLDDPNTIAGLKAETLTSLRIDFDLEDIIAGNTPDGDAGLQLLAIVDDSQGLPTQGKVEAALIPLYETIAANMYRQEGGTAQPPAANRQHVREHAVKVIQARKVKRTTLARAARGASIPVAGHSSRMTGLQLVVIACLALLIAAFYFR
jgi:hypothetical protein